MEPFTRDIRQEILLRSTIDDIYNLCQTNKDYSSLCREEYLWNLKYQQDFGSKIVDDKIAKELNLTPRQTYIRRYTQEGGVTYGSELFRDLSKLIPAVIMSQEPLLINYYMNLLRKITIKYQRLDKSERNNYYVVNWFEVMKAALWITNKDLAQEIYNLLPKDDIDYFIRLAIELYEGSIGVDVDQPSEYHLEGALLMNRFDLANKYLVNQDSSTIANLAVSTQNEDWLENLVNTNPEIFNSYDLAMAYLSNGILSPEILDILSPGLIISVMVQRKIYDLDFFVEAIKRYNKDEKIEILPCYPEYLSYIEQYKDKLYSEWELLLAVGQCTPEDYHRLFKDDFPLYDVIDLAIKENNYPLILDLVETIPPNRTNRITTSYNSIIKKALMEGKKDLWYYLVVKYNKGRDMGPEIGVPIEMKFLQEEYKLDNSKNFTILSSRVFK